MRILSRPTAKPAEEAWFMGVNDYSENAVLSGNG